MGRTPVPGRLAAALLVTAFLTFTGCTPSSDQPKVRWVGDEAGTSFGVAVPVADPATPMTVLVGGLCRMGTGVPTVTGVTFAQTDGIEVAGFATGTRDASQGRAGAEPKALAEAGYDPKSTAVPTVCGPEGGKQVTDLAVQVRATGTRRVRASGVVVSFAGGSVKIPMTLILCVGVTEGGHCAGE